MTDITVRKSNGTLYPVGGKAVEYFDGLPDGETITITHKNKHKTRRNVLNGFSHAIYAEAAKALGDISSQEAKAQCKYHFGIPILTHDPEDGVECMDYYKRLLTGVSYEHRIARMQENHKFYIPVTSLMTDEQTSEYLTRILQHYAEQGIVILTPKEKEYLRYPEAA